MSDTERNKRAVRSHFDVLNTGDYARLEGLHDPDGRNHAPAAFDLSPWPVEGKPFGPTDVRATFEWLRTAMPDLEVTILDLIAEGDRVAARVQMRGTQTGQFGAAPATRKALDFQHVHVFRFDESKIVEHWAVRDDLRAMLQLGVVAAPGPT
jgi:predicted ester cyclase